MYGESCEILGPFKPTSDRSALSFAAWLQVDGSLAFSGYPTVWKRLFLEFVLFDEFFAASKLKRSCDA